MNAFVRFAALLVVLALSGCMATSPNWDARFGEATRTVIAQQIISPEASKGQPEDRGIDGKAAQGAMGEYEKSFTKPKPQPTTFTIGVGGK